MDNGFIFLHRKFKEWEWYKNINVKTLFTHCLIMANFKDNKWQGIEIKRGSFITSIKSLSNETGLSERQVRTALDKLILTNELTNKSTNKNRTITVLKYDEYQSFDKRVDKLLTNNRQSNDKPLTITNKENNLNKENNVDTLFVKACELIKEEFNRYLTMEEIQIIQRWVNIDKFTYDEIYNALFFIIKERNFNLKYMYGILKNRRGSNNGSN